ncbi:MAG TPA: TetR/AcrR family transcriptional regulator [Acidimicrobiales bacterium]|nr:TetR/AcrR family transcriptional regulator [Acidimicrobiales bacterium]
MSQHRQPGVDVDAVLDAASSCYLRFGVAKTTAADIAQGVGVSRATLYRRFGGHEAIFLAVLARESAAMAVDAESHLADVADPSERILEGMMFAIEEVRRRPVHAAVFGGDSAAWAATRAIHVEALRHIGEAGVRPLLASSLADGSVSDQDMSDLVDWILRVLISYAAVPGDGGRHPAEIRRQLATWFLPAFAERLGGASNPSVRH